MNKLHRNSFVILRGNITFSLGNNVFVEASGYIGVPKFCEEGIVDVELFRPVA